MPSRPIRFTLNQPVELGMPFQGELPVGAASSFVLAMTRFPEDRLAFANSILCPTLFLFEESPTFYFAANSTQQRYSLDALAIYASGNLPDGMVILQFHDMQRQMLFRVPGRMGDYEPSDIENAEMNNQDCLRVIQVDIATGRFNYYAQYDAARGFFDVLYKVYRRDGRGASSKNVTEQFRQLMTFPPAQIWDASMQWTWDPQVRSHVRLR